MTSASSKHAGSRRGARPRAQLRPQALVVSCAITAAMIGWGYLVYVAITYGQRIRSGDGEAWGPAALAGLGAVACLFVGFILVARLLRMLGIVEPSHPRPTPSGPVGGHRDRSGHR